MRILRIILFLFALSFFRDGQAQTQTPFALVHNGSGLGSPLPLKEAAKIYQAKYTRWPKTEEQVIIVLPSSKHPAAAAQSRLLYKGSFRDLQKFWLSLVFQGRYSPPVFLDSDQEVIQYVLQNKGAVGIVSADQTTTLKKENVSLIIQ
ncbi:MAG: hypothetical protein RJA57_1544 [Bacteroidota bacterium]|jgi:ABC-type phosphate transport system substrate-binding protein